jgi:DNA-directed RNA polymerase specialized sigma24 family protein
LFTLTSPLVARWVALDPARIRHADESIDDLSQNICLRVFRKLKHFRGTTLVRDGGAAPPQVDDASVWKLYRSWLRETARRIVLNDRKKYQRREAPSTSDSPGSVRGRLWMPSGP